jgi:hypothetical protein
MKSFPRSLWIGRTIIDITMDVIVSLILGFLTFILIRLLIAGIVTIPQTIKDFYIPIKKIFTLGGF